MIAVQVGEEQRPQGTGTRTGGGRPHQDAPAAVEEQIPGVGADQTSKDPPGPDRAAGSRCPG